MNSFQQQSFEEDSGKRRRPARIFSFKRAKEPKQGDPYSSVFTEVPPELKYQVSPWWRIGHILQKILNFLMMTILVLALVALVAAFAYEIIFYPDVLEAWSKNLVDTVMQTIQSWSGATP